MHRFTAVMFALLIALAGCVEEEPECDFDDDTSCTCDDGSQGELICSDGEMSCVCDDGSQE